MAISLAERIGMISPPIEATLWQWACMLRCAVPGKVVSFNAEKQTCVVQIMIQERVWLPPKTDDPIPLPGTTQNVPTWDTIPALQDVPILMPHAGGWSLTFPVVEGSECLLIFADNCIDGWWQSGELSVQYDRRRHDLSDAFALFGPWSQPRRLTNYSPASMQLRSDDGSVVIDLAPGKITATAPEIALVGNVTVTGNLSVTTGVAGASITAPDIFLNGNVWASADVVGQPGSISLVNHIHDIHGNTTYPPIPLVAAQQPGPEPPAAEPKEDAE
jgi:hypothetical protein